jgi:RimJ/RimL family protein N-acetyltransferase
MVRRISITRSSCNEETRHERIPRNESATTVLKHLMIVSRPFDMPQVELLDVADSDFDWMLGIVQDHEGLRLPPGGVDDPAVLQIVRDMTKKLHAAGCTGSWMIVRDGEVVGLCSYKRPPAQGRVEIGYGTAPQRRESGIATAAVAVIAQIASADHVIEALTAETSSNNLASQRVLEKNGFVRTGRRTDDEDGEVIGWIKTLR